jgi:hypothetical protein
MTKIAALLGLVLLATTAVSAEARDRFHYRFFAPWHDREVYLMDDSEDDDAYFEEDTYDDEDVVIVKRRPRVQPRVVEDDIWWMEDDARIKMEKRKSLRKPVRKVVIEDVPLKSKPKLKPTPTLKVDRDVQTASLNKPDVVVKPKVKPVAPKPVASKTIGCTAGAAVVTGYGFGDVKPKACTGSTYAYTAARAGKIYQIKLTAASGEIIDVKKVN